MSMLKRLGRFMRCGRVDNEQDNSGKDTDQPPRPVREPEPAAAAPVAAAPAAAEPDVVQHASAANSGQIAVTRQAIDTFLASKLDNGEIGGLGYWQTANGYTAIVLHDRFAGERYIGSYILPAMDKILARMPNFINEYNDDTQWWAHCLLNLQPFVSNPLSQPKGHSVSWLHNNLTAIWQHVSAYQLPLGRYIVNGGQDMGGAVLWTSKQGEVSVNSITTGLFAALSARLAVLLCPSTPSDPDRQAAHPYMAAAEAAVNWIFNECYRPADKIVLDTVNIQTGARLDYTFTYTTAVGISALARLAIARRLIPSWHKQQEAYDSMRQACDIARSAMVRPQWVDPATGVLNEQGVYSRGTQDPFQNNDSIGFKSVMVRSLCELYTILKSSDPLIRDLVKDQSSLAPQIKTFVQKQFNDLQQRDTNGQGQYGPWWEGPFEAPTGWSQMAVLDVMAGIHNVSVL